MLLSSSSAARPVAVHIPAVHSAAVRHIPEHSAVARCMSELRSLPERCIPAAVVQPVSPQLPELLLLPELPLRSVLPRLPEFPLQPEPLPLPEFPLQPESLPLPGSPLPPEQLPLRLVLPRLPEQARLLVLLQPLRRNIRRNVRPVVIHYHILHTSSFFPFLSS